MHPPPSCTAPAHPLTLCRRRRPPRPQAALVQQWQAADTGVKKQVKQNLLATLGTQVGMG